MKKPKKKKVAKAKAPKPDMSTDLVGLPFHIFKDGKIDSRGTVIGMVGTSDYMIRTDDENVESGVIGIVSLEKIMSTEDAVWQFYDDEDHRAEYEERYYPDEDEQSGSE